MQLEVSGFTPDLCRNSLASLADLDRMPLIQEARCAWLAKVGSFLTSMAPTVQARATIVAVGFTPPQDHPSVCPAIPASSHPKLVQVIALLVPQAPMPLP